MDGLPTDYRLGQMPELPEVETIVQDIRPDLVGRTIRRASLSHVDVLRGVTRPKLLAALKGAAIRSVTRRAKHAVIALGQRRLVIQPGMTGSLTVHRKPLTRDEARYAVLRAPLDSGRELVYQDVRRLGTLLLLNERQWAAYDAAIGPEPLEPGFTAEAFHASLKRTRQAIKKALMDQKLIAGVGNIYANEALFAAGIDPSRSAASLSQTEYGRLFVELRRILTAAIDAEGTTFRDYRTGTGEPGNFQLELLVYGREGKPCRRCGTRLVGTHAIDARISVFCYRCQR